MVEIVKMGSLYFDSKPQEVCHIYNHGELTFGPGVDGKKLHWVKLKNDFLVANRCICTNISWVQLDSMGFVFGKPIEIEGKKYLCRCLQVGDSPWKPNEWDAIVDELGRESKVLHWQKTAFWGQEIAQTDPTPEPQ